MKFYISNSSKVFILNFYLFIYLFAFTRNISNIYYIFLVIAFLLCLLVFLIESDSLDFKNNLIFIYTVYVSYHSLIILISIFNMNKFQLSIDNIAAGSARMLLAPLIIILMYSLVVNIKKFKYVIRFYYTFIFFAALSIILQHFLGQFEFLSPAYGAPRHGLIGYASITGNVTSYSPAAAIASILIFFDKSRLYLFKSIVISIIAAAAILTMGKSGLMNVLFIVIIILFLSVKLKEYRTIIYIILFGLIGTFASSTLYFAIISLFVNTTGIEILGFKLSTAVEFQEFLPRITDRLFGRFLSFEEISLFDTVFGIGIKGGGGALGISNTGTSHNSYIDTFVIGGLIYLFIFLAMILITQHYLLKNYRLYNDNVSYGLFFSNFLFLINIFLINGSIYQPVISFIFWMSILYVINFKKMYLK